MKLPKTYAALHSAIAYFGRAYPLDRERRMDKLFEIEEQFGEDVFDEANDIIIGGADEDYFMDLVLADLDALYRERPELLEEAV